MNAPRRPVLPVLLAAMTGTACALLLGTACDRSNPAPASASGSTAMRADSTSTADTAATTAPVIQQSWPGALGPELLVETDAPTRATVVDSGDTTGAAQPARGPGRVVLLGRDRRVQIATLAPEGVSPTGCAMGTIKSGGAPLRPWTVGFAADSIHPLTLDSSASFGHGDLITLTSGVTRLASAVPGDSAGTFFGLPFVVDAVWRFTIPGDTQVVVGMLHRQINQEAMPLAERTLIVAEQDSSTAGELVAAYSDRSSGDEETVETYDLLAALTAGGSPSPMLVLARDFGNGVSYAFLERTGPRTWRVRWTSPTRKCS